MGKSITDLSSVTTVGLDLAKHVFQVHGVDASGRVIVAKALRRKDVLAFFGCWSRRPQASSALRGLAHLGSGSDLGRLGGERRTYSPIHDQLRGKDYQ